MKIVNVFFYYDEFINTCEEFLEFYYTLTGWAEALHKKGVEVVTVIRFKYDNVFTRNGVQYYFIKDGFGGSLKSWQLPLAFLKSIARQNADIVHTHTFPCSLPVFLLRFLLKKNTAIVIQNHGGKPGKGIKMMLYKQMARIADAFFFTAAEQGRHWFKSRRLLKKVMPVMEGAPVFNPKTMDAERILDYTSRTEQRLKTGIAGNPIFLWVGGLDENKDPLTILKGMQTVFKKHSNAELYMIYRNEKLLNEVSLEISSAEILKNRVHLAGAVAHEQMEVYYKSADYFVLGSHYEGSCYSLSEALSCGCVPVVTDIPSFHVMTNNGKLGALWQAGNANAFADALQMALEKPLNEEANACIEFFKLRLSFDGIAEITIEYYEKVINSRMKAK